HVNCLLIHRAARPAWTTASCASHASHVARQGAVFFREPALVIFAAGGRDDAPIVVAGAGPVGVRVTGELLRRCPDRDIVLYGEEDAEPYDRVQLSSLLMGDVTEERLFAGMRLPATPRLTRH